MWDSYGLLGTLKVSASLNEYLKVLLSAYQRFNNNFNQSELMLWRFEVLSIWYVDKCKNTSP